MHLARKDGSRLLWLQGRTTVLETDKSTAAATMMVCHQE